MTSTGKRTKEFRYKIGLNQTQLANELDLTPQAVQRVESDNGNFNIKTIQKLNDIYNLNLNWYFNGIGDIFSKPQNTFAIRYEPLKIDWYEVGKRIIKIRVTADLLSAQMAQMIEINEKEFAEICVGKKKPTFEILQRICENFDTTMDYILFGKE